MGFRPWKSLLDFQNLGFVSLSKMENRYTKASWWFGQKLFWSFLGSWDTSKMYVQKVGKIPPKKYLSTGLVSHPKIAHFWVKGQFIHYYLSRVVINHDIHLVIRYPCYKNKGSYCSDFYLFVPFERCLALKNL